MTMIMGLCAFGAAYQVGDRLLSVQLGSQLVEYDRASNKQVVVDCRDAIVIIGYAGRAHLQGRPVDVLIAEAATGERFSEPFAMKLSSGPRRSLFDVIENVRRRLQEGTAWDREPGIEVLVTGIRWDGKRSRREPVTWLIRSGNRFVVERKETTPFPWNSRSVYESVGLVEQQHLEAAHLRVSDIYKALQRLEPDRPPSYEVLEVLSDCLVAGAETTPGVGREVMSIMVSLEYGRRKVRTDVLGVGTSSVSVSSPWMVSGGTALAPSKMVGGGWVLGDLDFEVASRDHQGRTVFSMHEEDRKPPPGRRWRPGYSATLGRLRNGP